MDYALMMALILWESLLNWYRFYSTKFMSLKLVKPPYHKIFALYFLYMLLFLTLCVAQIYMVFLLFPVVIMVHVLLNSYCCYGFMTVLRGQYRHYVMDCHGISKEIVDELRGTMHKLKLCAASTIASSTLFLLTLAVCRYGGTVLLSAPLWWTTNCVCWTLTFAKNEVCFKRMCSKCCSLKCDRRHQHRRGHKKKKSKEAKDAKEGTERDSGSPSTVLPGASVHASGSNKLLYVEYLSKSNERAEVEVPTEVQLETIMDGRECKDSPLSIGITPTGQQPVHRADGQRSSVTMTYQYPNDYEDGVDNERDNDYFTFPGGHRVNMQEVSGTTTTTRKMPKAFALLGVKENEKSLSKESPSHRALRMVSSDSDAVIQRGQSAPSKSKQNGNAHQTNDEPSVDVLQLLVHDGLFPLQTMRSLHELEEYSMAAHERAQSHTLSKQRSSRI